QDRTIYNMPPLPPRYTLFPYTTLFRSGGENGAVFRGVGLENRADGGVDLGVHEHHVFVMLKSFEHKLSAELDRAGGVNDDIDLRSEEHTSELQSLRHLVCRLLLEKKNI